MTTWKTKLKADPTEWLLEENNPSVRYFTLRDILEKSEHDGEMQEAKKDVMKNGVVPAILKKQKQQGFWEEPERFYTAKYQGTVWQLLLLAELGADKTNENVRKACEFILNNSQDPESGGFAHSSSSKKGGGRHSEVIPCLTGNMVYSLIRLGYLDDPRLKQGINWITTYQRFDDGDQPAIKGWPYDRLKAACLGKHTCHMGAAKTLKALAEIPDKKRTAAVKQTIEQGAQYFLLHHIFKSSHDLKKIPKPGWLKFGFPLMYQTDALEILGILTTLGYHDERMQEAVDIVVSKQDSAGRWKLENTFNGKYFVNIEQKDKPSKWMTLKSITAIKQFYS
jgi:hypothetical protein